MDKSQLIKSASLLNDVSTSAAYEYSNKSDKLIAEINERISSRQDLELLVGNGNLAMMRDNHANHVRFISSIIKNRNDEVLVETILWVFHAYKNHGFSTSYWAAQLNTWIEILQQNLTKETYAEIYPYYEWMQVNIPIFSVLSENFTGHHIPEHQ